MARAAAPMFSGLRGRTNTTTSSPSLEDATKTAQFYDIRFCFASFAKPLPLKALKPLAAMVAKKFDSVFRLHSLPVSSQRKQDEGRNYSCLLALARRIVKKLSNHQKLHAQRPKSL
jgi:hypothetical protein